MPFNHTLNNCVQQKAGSVKQKNFTGAHRVINRSQFKKN